MPVYPHGPLVRLADDLWQVTGSLPNMALPRNMVVWRHPSGGLWLHSVVALDEPTLQALVALGEPRWSVVPSGLHRMDAPWYKERFPDMQVLAPVAARKQVEEKVPVDHTCEEALPPLGVGCLTPAGLKPAELTYRLPLAGGGAALVFNDALFHLREPVRGFGGFMLRLMGSWGYFGLTRIGRWFLLQEGAAYARWLRELAADPELRVLTVSHGLAVTEDVAGRLREAADRLG